MSEEEKEFEIAELSSLKKEMNPPPELEEQVLSQLRKRGLLRRKSQAPMRRFLFVSAAAIVIFALGFISALFFHRSITTPKYTYLLLLREDSHFYGTRTHEYSLVKEYSNWARGVAQKGTEITGEKLTAESRLLSANARVQKKVQDPDGQIAGFFLIDAKNDQEALDKAFSCPHLRYDGNIELRRIDK